MNLTMKIIISCSLTIYKDPDRGRHFCFFIKLFSHISCCCCGFMCLIFGPKICHYLIIIVISQLTVVSIFIFFISTRCS